MSQQSAGDRLAAARLRIKEGVGLVHEQSTRTVKASSAAAERAARERAVVSAYGDLADASAAAVDDLMNLRNCDAWSTSFGFLVNLSLAGMAAAQARRDPRGQAAMLLNLVSLLQEVQGNFSDERLPFQRWEAAIAAMGGGAIGLDSVKDRHPHAGTLQRHIRVVRDTGLALGGITEFYAMSGGQVYAIRPA